MIILRRAAYAMLIAALNPAQAGEIFTKFPTDIDADASYVIYSHGLIVEGENPTPVHPDWGMYDFPGVKTALAAGGNFHLVAHHRPRNTEVGPYVVQLQSWVRRLVLEGVKPERITLIGFSRGGEFTALAASELRPLPINTVLLATCWDHGVQDEPGIKLAGRFLSIFETTDVALTCEKLAHRSDQLTKFKEVAITTNDEHGAFFRPRAEWIDPLLSWLRDVSD
tara:strand:+ start:1686 stop:2357 length:672 start_codon:yes stop_codon:yes gene_type:complete